MHHNTANWTGKSIHHTVYVHWTHNITESRCNSEIPIVLKICDFEWCTFSNDFSWGWEMATISTHTMYKQIWILLSPVSLFYYWSTRLQISVHYWYKYFISYNHRQTDYWNIFRSRFLYYSPGSSTTLGSHHGQQVRQLPRLSIPAAHRTIPKQKLFISTKQAISLSQYLLYTKSTIRMFKIETSR
jgi:hypothetical protein